MGISCWEVLRWEAMLFLDLWERMDFWEGRRLRGTDARLALLRVLFASTSPGSSWGMGGGRGSSLFVLAGTGAAGCAPESDASCTPASLWSACIVDVVLCGPDHVGEIRLSWIVWPRRPRNRYEPTFMSQGVIAVSWLMSQCMRVCAAEPVRCHAGAVPTQS